MKKYLITLCGMLGMTAVHAQNTINISAGTTVVTSGTVSVVANANDFVNNGAYTDNTGTFLAAGGVTFSGSGTTTLFNFNVNNDSITTLSSLVSVQNTATLTSGTLTAGSNELYIRSDLYPTLANLVVEGSLTGTVNGLITNATVTTGPCPVSSTLSTNVSGSAALYQWQSSADNSTWGNISGATSATYAAMVTATAYYRCNLTTNNSVFSEATRGLLITATGIPIVSGGLNTAIYSGGSTTLTASGAATYNWSPATGLSVTTGASVTASPTANTIYTVTGTNTCSSSAEVGVSVNAVPTLSGSTACTGSVLTVTSAAQPMQIVWQKGGVNTATVTPTYAANGTTVAGGNGDGSNANQLVGPQGIYVDGSGNVYVVDGGNARVQKWVPGATGGVTVAGGNGVGSAANQLSSPVGLFVDGSGNIYIADYANQRIQKWVPGATSGVTVAGGNGRGGNANQLAFPACVYVDGSGNIYVADQDNYRIQEWAPGATSGVTVAGGNGPGDAANQLWGPSGLYVDAAGNMYIANGGNGRVQKWAPGATSSTIVAGGNGSGSAANQLIDPDGIYVDGSGNIYVADQNNNRIQEWAPGAASGVTVAGGHGLGSAADQLHYPASVYLDGSGNIYVADAANNRIQEFAAAITTTLTTTSAGNYDAIVTTLAGAITTNTVTINALPVAITGNAQICVAGAGITLSDISSPNGVWSSNNTLVANVNAATGAVTSGMQGTATITYATGCGTAATITATVNATPAAISGNAPLCANASTITLTNTSTNGTWSSSNATVASVNEFTGHVTSGAVGGAVIITYSNGCSPAAAVTFTVNPLPAIHTFTGGGAYCALDSGVHVGLTLSDTGISYQLYNGSTAVGSPVQGTGADIDFGLKTAPGVYHAIATNTVTTCTNYLSGVTISINPLPDTFTVTGGGSYCAAATGVHVGLNGSANGTNYQLYNGSSPIGSAMTGTGHPLDFGLQTGSGVYTVMASNAITFCSQAMAGSATVTVIPLPTADTVTGGGGYCANASGVHVGLDSSTAGIIYQLYKGSSPIGTPVTSAGGALDFGLQTNRGVYTIIATDPVTTCSSMMTGSVTVTVNPLPDTFAITGGGSYCADGNGVHVGLSGSHLGISYQLYNGAAAAGSALNGTGSTLDFGLITAAGVYKVVGTDTTTHCMNAKNDSAVVTITPMAVTHLQINTGEGAGDTVCGGAPVTFTAQTINGGASPTYQWNVENLNVGTNDSTYTYTPSLGNVIAVTMISSAICAMPDTLYDTMSIQIQAPLTPSVFIVVTPINTISLGQPDTLIAVATNCGSGPRYQWYKNGNLIVGATNTMYTSNTFANHDSMSVRVLTSGACGGEVTDNSVIITVYPAGIQQVPSGTGDVKLFPNPNKGSFTISGTLDVQSDEEVAIEVTDMLGQVIYRNNVTAKGGILNEQVQLYNLANGMYLLNLRSGSGQKVFHFVLEQ